MVDAAIEASINGTPGQVVSRIFSPRILKPRTAYRAFVVPTFERGRLVGTGEAPGDTDALKPAWTRPADSDTAGLDQAITLPVYYEGHSYRCLQTHMSQPDWQPPNTPALWQLIA